MWIWGHHQCSTLIFSCSICAFIVILFNLFFRILFILYLDKILGHNTKAGSQRLLYICPLIECLGYQLHKKKYSKIQQLKARNIFLVLTIVLLDRTHLSSSCALHDVVRSSVIWGFNYTGSYKMVHYKVHDQQLVLVVWLNKQTNEKPHFSSIWTFYVLLTSLSMAMGYQEHRSRSVHPFLG